MTYEKEILQILEEANHSCGLSLNTIVRHVYNMTACDMFSGRSHEDVHKDVAKYLHVESALKCGSVKKAALRGYYCINESSQKVQQLMLEFEHDHDNDIIEY